MKSAIRDADAADIASLAELVGEVQAPHVASRPETFKELRSEEVADWLRGLFQNPSVRVWVADVDGVVQGYLVAVVRRQSEGPFTFERISIELDQIGVRRAYRRSGVARALVKAAVAYAEAAGIRAIELTSWAFNQGAHEAFRKLGFAPKVVRFELSPSAGLRESRD
jgi:GNAT superfamily N-acetyltransferase